MCEVEKYTETPNVKYVQNDNKVRFEKGGYGLGVPVGKFLFDIVNNYLNTTSVKLEVLLFVRTISIDSEIWLFS